MNIVYYIITAIVSGCVIGSYFTLLCRNRKKSTWVVFGGIFFSEFLFRFISFYSISTGMGYEIKASAYIFKLMAQLLWLYYVEERFYETYLNGMLFLLFMNVPMEVLLMPILQAVFGLSSIQIHQIGIGNIQSLTDTAFFILFIVLSILPTYTIIFLIRKKHFYKYRIPGSYKEIAYTMLVATDVFVTSFQTQGTFFMSITLTLIMSFVFLLAFLFSLQLIRKKERKLLEEKLITQTQYYQQLSKRQLTLRKMRHDLANHIQVITNLQLVNQKDAADMYRIQLENYEGQFSALEKGIVEEWEELDDFKTADIMGRKEKKQVLFRMMVSYLGVFVMQQTMRNHVVLRDYFAISIVILMLILTAFVIAQLMIKWKKKKNLELQNRLQLQEKENRQWKELQDSVEKEIKNSLDNPDNNNPVRLMNLFDSVIAAQTTGNPIIDVMIQSKLIQCKEKEIEIQCQIAIKKEWKIPERVYVGILGNLLDNAIESCVKVPRGQRRIKISSQIKANYWSIHMSNSKAVTESATIQQSSTGTETARHSTPLLKTTKKNSEQHGLGTQIIAEMVERYNGMIQYEDQGENFVTNLMIEIPENK